MSTQSSHAIAIALTDLDSQTANVIRTVHERREPVVLTRGENRLAVVLSPEAFDRLAADSDRVRLRTAVDEAESEIERGELVENDAVMTELDRWAADEG